MAKLTHVALSRNDYKQTRITCLVVPLTIIPLTWNGMEDLNSFVLISKIEFAISL